jgi:hypothetical protein
MCSLITGRADLNPCFETLMPLGVPFGTFTFRRVNSGSPSARAFATIFFATTADSVKSWLRVAARLTAIPGTPRIVASRAPATVPE